MSLDLYAQIEPYFDFKDAIRTLHQQFLSIIKAKELNQILDVGCGSGQFLKQLTDQGIQAMGIDLSQEQIKQCQALGLNAHQQPLSKVQGSFHAITAIFDVINYIPNKDLNTFFSHIYKRLNDNGYFIFDINSLFGFEEIAQGDLTINQTDRFIALHSVFNHPKLITDITHFSKTDNGLYQKEQSSITQYYHDPIVLEQKLQTIGFDIQSVINLNLYSENETDKLIMVCQKRF